MKNTLQIYVKLFYSTKYFLTFAIIFPTGPPWKLGRMRYIPSSKNIHKVLISKGLIRREATRSSTDGLTLYRAKRSLGIYLLILDAKLLGDVIGES